MNTILFFHTSQRQAWRKELAGAYRFARVRNWRVQVVEPSTKPPDVPALIEFWNPVGCIAECSGMPSAYFDVASFGDVPVVFLGGFFYQLISEGKAQYIIPYFIVMTAFAAFGIVSFYDTVKARVNPESRFGRICAEKYPAAAAVSGAEQAASADPAAKNDSAEPAQTEKAAAAEPEQDPVPEPPRASAAQNPAKKKQSRHKKGAKK